MTKSVLGIVGGSGLYDIPALENVRWQAVNSPFGQPSDQILFADLDGLEPQHFRTSGFMEADRVCHLVHP